MKSQKGMSLMSVLVAVAIAGVIAATLATLYENMTQLMLRSNVTAEMDNTQRYIQGILSQRVLCERALRDALGGNKLTFDSIDGEVSEVGVIQIQNSDSAVPVLALGRNSRVTPSLVVSDLELRNPDLDGDDNPANNPTSYDPGNPDNTRIDGVPYRIHQAELAITFNWTGGDLIGGANLRVRKIPLVLTVHAVTNVIDFCDYAEEDVLSADCDAFVPSDGSAFPAGPNVPPSCSVARRTDPTGQVCPRIGFVSSVDARGEPRCECRDLCPAGSGGSAPASSTTSPGPTTTPPGPTTTPPGPTTTPPGPTTTPPGPTTTPPGPTTTPPGPGTVPTGPGTTPTGPGPGSSPSGN